MSTEAPRAPDLLGPATRIWQCRNVPEKLRRAGVATWCAHAPWSHPIWAWHAISLIHLRDVEGLPPATLRLPDATHELMIISIDPERCPEPDPDTPPWPYLTPLDLQHQFIRTSDAEALRSVEEAIEMVRQHRLSLDQDYRRAWRNLLGGEPHG